MNDLSPSLLFGRPSAQTLADRLNWLAALFAVPPTPECVASYRRGPGAEMLCDLAKDPGLAHGVALLREALDTAADDTTVAGQLGRSFGLLFEGIGGPDTVPPYESAFRPGGTWRLFQAPTAEMDALLAERDLSVSPDSSIPADHLAIELALTAHVAAAGDEAAATAMFERLAGWISAFADACVDADGEGFWAGAATVLAAVVASQNHPFKIAEEEANA
jgi:TorA-specific chaperone